MVKPDPVGPKKIIGVLRMKVLFIDDELMLCNLGERILKRAGYEVVIAKSGQEGIDAFSTAPDEFDIIIIDSNMNGLNGIETLQQLRILKPEIPFILSSGHQLDEQDLPSDLLDNMGFLSKPYRSHQLVDKVEEVLAINIPQD